MEDCAILFLHDEPTTVIMRPRFAVHAYEGSDDVADKSWKAQS